MDRSEIIGIIKKLINGEGTEEEEETWMEQLDKNVPYYHEIFEIITTSKEQLTPEEILDKAEKNYKPIILP